MHFSFVLSSAATNAISNETPPLLAHLRYSPPFILFPFGHVPNVKARGVTQFSKGGNPGSVDTGGLLTSDLGLGVFLQNGRLLQQETQGLITGTLQQVFITGTLQQVLITGV